MMDQAPPTAPIYRAPLGDPLMGVFPNRDTYKENWKIKERDHMGEETSKVKGWVFLNLVPSPSLKLKGHCWTKDYNLLPLNNFVIWF